MSTEADRRTLNLALSAKRSAQSGFQNEAIEQVIMVQRGMQEHHDAVDGLLAKLAHDNDFQDDLKQPLVQKAIRHWTAEQRLPPQEAEKLGNDARVVTVLDHLKELQVACQRAGIALPLHHVLEGKRKLDLSVPVGRSDPSLGQHRPTDSRQHGQVSESAETRSTVSRRVQSNSDSARGALPQARAHSEEKLPATVWDWLHLATPILMIVLTFIASFWFKSFSVEPTVNHKQP